MVGSSSGPPPPTVCCALFADPVKLLEEPGYPAPTVRDVLTASDGTDASSTMQISVVSVTLDEVIDGCLVDPERGFTVLCVMGGFAPNYASRLGDAGYNRIREFVSNGGGYVGLCAGAYLATNQGIGLVPVDVVDIHRWARGSGACQIEFTADGAIALGALEPSAAAAPVTVRYANGPLMRISGPGVTALANFVSEFRGPQGDYPPRMAGSPAVVLGRCTGGGGLVALVSPHLEDGTDTRSLTPFRNLFHLASRDSLLQRWLAGGGSSEAEVAPSLLEALAIMRR